MNECIICKKQTKNKKFCSHKCHGKSMEKKYEATCERCGVIFYYNNISYKNFGRLKSCSQQCKNRKYMVDEYYFSDESLSNEKLITLGQFVATAQIVDYKTIKLFSDLETLTDISNKLKSTYIIKKSDKGKHRLQIMSDKMVLDLIELGLCDSKLLQYVPRDDIWEGLFKTDCYTLNDDGIHEFKTESSKIANWVCEKFNGQIATNIYKDTYRNKVGCYFFVFW